MKCAAHGCVNESHQGEFIGQYCVACLHALRTGKATHGTSWIFTQAARLAEAERLLRIVRPALGDNAPVYFGSLTEHGVKWGEPVKSDFSDALKRISATVCRHTAAYPINAGESKVCPSCGDLLAATPVAY
jgi:hypothetical protein